jgi:hypothetical protein
MAQDPLEHTGKQRRRADVPASQSGDPIHAGRQLFGATDTSEIGHDGSRYDLPRPLPIRMGSRHRWWIYAVFTALWVSGLLWLLFHYFVQVQGNFGPRPHPLEHWWLRLHGLAAMLTLIALGSVLPQHMRGAWEMARNRMRGTCLIIVMVWLTLTGYALYYFTTADNQAWLSLLHWLPGLAVPLLLWEHIRRGRNQARAGPAGVRSRQPGSAPAQRQPGFMTNADSPAAEGIQEPRPLGSRGVS